VMRCRRRTAKSLEPGIILDMDAGKKNVGR
jgi:hypothetical protein